MGKFINEVKTYRAGFGLGQTTMGLVTPQKVEDGGTTDEDVDEDAEVANEKDKDTKAMVSKVSKKNNHSKKSKKKFDFKLNDLVIVHNRTFNRSSFAKITKLEDTGAWVKFAKGAAQFREARYISMQL